MDKERTVIHLPAELKKQDELVNWKKGRADYCCA